MKGLKPQLTDSMSFISCDLGKTNIWSDSRCFFSTYPFFERLFSKKSNINLDFELERMLGVCVYQMMKKREGKFLFLPLPLRISGVGGGVGIEYDITECQYKKMLIKHSLIRLLFNLGILPKLKKEQIKKYAEK